MNKEICYKFNDCIISIDISENDLSCVYIGKHIVEDCIENIFTSYDEKVVNFFLCFIDKITDLEAKLAESEKERQHLKDWLDDVLLTSVDHESFNAMQEEYEKENEQLKQQLAEKDAELNRYAELFGMKDKDFYVVEKVEYDKMKQGAKDIVNKLKQKLAEKEKEIKCLNKNWNDLCDYLGECIVKYDKEDFNGIYSEVLSKVNELKSYDVKADQDKIDFVIEKLEKVKEEMTLNGNSYCEIRESTSPHNPNSYSWFNYVKFKEMIEQQIKELKEKK